jgi:hypothetical protein
VRHVVRDEDGNPMRQLAGTIAATLLVVAIA